MTQPTPSTARIPPEVARYLQGPSPQSRQFDFLIGDWAVAANAYQPDGSPPRQYAAHWEARHLNGGRMVMDDFRALTPDGREVSSFVTLRTWSDTTNRWEITGLAALQPAPRAEWHGQWRDGEMQLEACGQDPTGAQVQTRIRFHDIQPQSFAWESQVSRDGGTTWHRAAALRATRVR